MRAALLSTKIHFSRCAELARRVLRAHLLSSHKLVSEGRTFILAPPTLLPGIGIDFRACVHVSKNPLPCIWFFCIYDIQQMIQFHREGFPVHAYDIIFLSLLLRTHIHVGDHHHRTAYNGPLLPMLSSFGFGLYSPHF